MYRCENCGSEFESPKLRMENLGEYWGTPAWEPWGTCPSCGSEEIEMEDHCPLCGEDYPHNGKDYCDKCFTVVNEAFQKTVNELADDWKFDKEKVIDVIIDIIEDM